MKTVTAIFFYAISNMLIYANAKVSTENTESAAKMEIKSQSKDPFPGKYQGK
ncbi:MAG: hypothetical protein IPP06_06215 [Saprospiraceae bacterium]|nr:hypothetical protein [Candidatus Vicinibacter affinis]